MLLVSGKKQLLKRKKEHVTSKNQLVSSKK